MQYARVGPDEAGAEEEDALEMTNLLQEEEVDGEVKSDDIEGGARTADPQLYSDAPRIAVRCDAQEEDDPFQDDVRAVDSAGSSVVVSSGDDESDVVGSLPLGGVGTASTEWV